MAQLEKESKVSICYSNDEDILEKLEKKYLRKNIKKKWYEKLLGKDNFSETVITILDMRFSKREVLSFTLIAFIFSLWAIGCFYANSQIKNNVQYIKNEYYQSLDKTNKTIIHDTLVAGREDTLSDLSAKIYHDLTKQGLNPKFVIANDKILVIEFGSQAKIEINLGLSTSIFSYSNLNIEEKEIVVKQLDENNYPGFNIVAIPMENKDTKGNTDITVFIKKVDDIYSNVPNVLTIPSSPIGVPLPTLPPMESPFPKQGVQLPETQLQVPNIPPNIEDMQKTIKEAPLPIVRPDIKVAPKNSNSSSEYKFGSGKIVPSPPTFNDNMKEKLDEINRRTNDLTREIDRQVKLLEEKNSQISKSYN